MKMMLAVALAGCLALAANQKRETAMHTATGTFDVKMLPPSAPPVPGDFVRLSLDKTFQGDLQGTSKVEMLASNGGDQASGGYVALERFTGTLQGKSGSFVMQHSGTMSPGAMDIKVLVSPGSGTGELAGIDGSLEIRKEGKQHFFTLKYTLPAAAK